MVIGIQEKIKLNKFKLVSIPSNRNLFARFGLSSSPASSYTGDSPANMDSSKIGMIMEGEKAFNEAVSVAQAKNVDDK